MLYLCYSYRKLRSSAAFVVLIAALLCVQTLPLHAQIGDDQPWRFGISGMGTMNMHNGPLTTFDGLQECGTFEDATTIGWSAGNYLWYRLSTNPSDFLNDVALTARLSYWKADGDFTAPNPVNPLVDIGDGTTVPLTTEYTAFTSLDYVTLDVVGQWYLAKNIYLALGPQIGFPTRAAFEQRENIIEPAFMEFTNGGTERTIHAADFSSNTTSTNLRVAALVGLGTDIWIAERFILSPEVSYVQAFTGVLSSSDWTVNAIRAGAHLTYSFGKDPEPEKAPEQPVNEPTVTAAPRAVPTVMLDLSSERADGTTVQGGDVLLSELRQNDVVPLLPHVFFAQNASDLQSRYHRGNPVSFKETELQGSVLDIYHSLLDIVGSRMQRYQQSTITLNGYRDPADGETNTSLGKERAETVASYLENVWGISRSRLKVLSGVLPPIVSNQNTTDGKEENRRVEILSSDSRVLAPVKRTEVQSTLDPRVVNIIPTITDRDEVASVSAEIVGDNATTLYAATNVGTEANWQPTAEKLQALLGNRSTARASATVTIESKAGETRTALAPLMIRREVSSKRYSNEIVNDSTIERFRVIFFDYDAPTISEFSKSTIELIRSRIRTTSSIRIVGLTDRTGSVEHNTRLSAQRAAAIDAAIKQRIVPERVTVSGAGPELIYDNDLPEGRFYNRTVLIEIATPVDEL